MQNLNDIIFNIKEFLNVYSPTGNTEKAQSFIIELCRKYGLHVLKNINGNMLISKSKHKTSGLLLSGHYDTVSGHLKVYNDNDHIYGRGACDMKSAIICMFSTLINSPEEISPTLFLTNDEETDSHGTNILLPYIDNDKYKACIVGEPTDMKINSAHMGRIVYELTIKENSVHASYMPDNNAMFKTSDIIRLLKDLPLRSNEFLGTDSITPVHIESEPGVFNITPSKITLYLDRRICNELDDYSQDILFLKDYFKQNTDFDFELNIQKDRMHNTLPYFCKDKRFIKTTQNVFSSNYLDKSLYPFTATCDASYIGQKIPVLISGPGSLKHAHTKDEKVSISDIINCEKLYKKINLEVSKWITEK